MTEYMNVRQALVDLIDGTTHADRSVTAVLRLQAGFATEAARPGRAVVLVYTSGGREGYLDRVDYATLEVYAPALEAERVAESLRSFLCGDPQLYGSEGKPHEVDDERYIDGIRCEVTPHDVPYASDSVARADTTLHVTHRPLL